LSACRTVSRLTVVTRPRATNSSASRHRVQRQRPWGGSQQATRINSCSTSPLIFTSSGRGGWGPRLMAASIPSVTKRWAARGVADAADGGQAGAQGVGDVLVDALLAGGIGQQEDAGMGELACRALADGDQPLQARALLHRQGNFVLGHSGTPSLEGRTVASMV